jgi:anti-sigma factor RsiW
MSDIHKLTGAYVLDAVDDLERARFEQHLAECDDCRAEVAELRETAALLAETTAVTPPASLRASVLSGISQVRPLPPEVTSPTSRGAEQRAGRRSWMPFLVAAAVAILVGVGAMVTQPWTTDDQPPPTAAELVLRADDAE